MNKFTKRSLSVLLALVMVLAFSIPAFAAPGDRPTAHNPVAKPAEIASVQINGETAYYETDDNTGSDIYIRAKVNQVLTALDAATVTINLNSAATPVTSTTLTFTGGGTATRTASNVDLLNQAYDVTIGSTTYTLAAGFGRVPLNAGDPLRVANVSIAGDSATVYIAVVQSPYMGNPYLVSNAIPWTDTDSNNFNYFVSVDLSSVPANRAQVAGTMTTATGAVISGDAVNTGGNNYEFDLSNPVPSFVVTNGGNERLYRVFASDPTTVNVGYLFDFTELGEDIYNEDFPYYEGNGPELRAKAAQIQAAINAYTGGQPITVPSGTTVMDIMLDFTAWANGDNPLSIDYFPYSTSNSGTYLAILNGLGEFDGGALSGWMYTDLPYSLTVSVPWVGAADYALTTDGTITWFYTTDYFNHF